jgi:hypothetical protein
MAPEPKVQGSSTRQQEEYDNENVYVEVNADRVQSAQASEISKGVKHVVQEDREKSVKSESANAWVNRIVDLSGFDQDGDLSRDELIGWLLKMGDDEEDAARDADDLLNGSDRYLVSDFVDVLWQLASSGDPAMADKLHCLEKSLNSESGAGPSKPALTISVPTDPKGSRSPQGLQGFPQSQRRSSTMESMSAEREDFEAGADSWVAHLLALSGLDQNPDGVLSHSELKGWLVKMGDNEEEAERDAGELTNGTDYPISDLVHMWWQLARSGDAVMAEKLQCLELALMDSPRNQDVAQSPRIAEVPSERLETESPAYKTAHVKISSEKDSGHDEISDAANGSEAIVSTRKEAQASARVDRWAQGLLVLSGLDPEGHLSFAELKVFMLKMGDSDEEAEREARELTTGSVHFPVYLLVSMWRRLARSSAAGDAAATAKLENLEAALRDERTTDRSLSSEPSPDNADVQDSERASNSSLSPSEATLDNADLQDSEVAFSPHLGPSEPLLEEDAQDNVDVQDSEQVLHRSLEPSERMLADAMVRPKTSGASPLDYFKLSQEGGIAPVFSCSAEDLLERRGRLRPIAAATLQRGLVIDGDGAVSEEGEAVHESEEEPGAEEPEADEKYFEDDEVDYGEGDEGDVMFEGDEIDIDRGESDDKKERVEGGEKHVPESGEGHDNDDDDDDAPGLGGDEIIDIDDEEGFLDLELSD